MSDIGPVERWATSLGGRKTWNSIITLWGRHHDAEDAARDAELRALKQAVADELHTYGEAHPIPSSCRYCGAVWPHPAVLSDRPICNGCLHKREAALRQAGEALRPFAQLIAHVERAAVVRDTEPIWAVNEISIKQGDVRTAVAALAAIEALEVKP